MINRILELHPCDESKVWITENKDKNLYDLWRSCHRGDWLLWLAVKIGIDRKIVVLTACDCAEQAIGFVKEGEQRPQQALDAARAWARGEASLEEVRKTAAYAANAAYAAYAAYDAAAYAANAAYAAYAAYDAAAYAAYAAAYAAYAAARREARAKSLLKSARIVRKSIPWKIWKEALGTL